MGVGARGIRMRSSSARDRRLRSRLRQDRSGHGRDFASVSSRFPAGSSSTASRRRIGTYSSPRHPRACGGRGGGNPPGMGALCGSGGEIVGIDRFGASAPYKVIYEKFGITARR